jgi:hypothetical protein
LREPIYDVADVGGRGERRDLGAIIDTAGYAMLLWVYYLHHMLLGVTPIADFHVCLK